MKIILEKNDSSTKEQEEKIDELINQEYSVNKNQRNFSEAEKFEDFSNQTQQLTPKNVLGKLCVDCDIIFETNDILP